MHFLRPHTTSHRPRAGTLEFGNLNEVINWMYSHLLHMYYISYLLMQVTQVLLHRLIDFLQFSHSTHVAWKQLLS